MAKTFRTVDGKGEYTIRLAGRKGEALESYWAGKATSRDTLSALRGINPPAVPPSESRKTHMEGSADFASCGRHTDRALISDRLAEVSCERCRSIATGSPLRAKYKIEPSFDHAYMADSDHPGMCRCGAHLHAHSKGK